MLPPGFPAEATEALQPVQRYDPALGRKLLAEAGYPDGKGFPRVEMWVRRDVRPVHEAGEAIHAMIKQNLGIDLVVRNMEVKIFMDAINSHQLPLGLVRFGADFIDPSSLMNLWLSSGRHAWRHDRFDQLVVQAGGVVGDYEARMDVYRQAERILVEEVGRSLRVVPDDEPDLEIGHQGGRPRTEPPRIPSLAGRADWKHGLHDLHRGRRGA